MTSTSLKIEKRQIRHGRVRARVFGLPDRPRLCVFRSLNYTYAQLIDDVNGVTLVSASTRGLKLKGKKVDASMELGKAIAEKAKSKGVKGVVFDRGGYKYHGRVKAVAAGAREGGLEF